MSSSHAGIGSGHCLLIIPRISRILPLTRALRAGTLA